MEDSVILALDFILSIIGNFVCKKNEFSMLIERMKRKERGRRRLSRHELMMELGYLLATLSIVGFSYICISSNLAMPVILGILGIVYTFSWIFSPISVPSIIEDKKPESKSRSS